MAIPANQRQRLANMKMGEHMGRRPVAPQQKKNDGLLDKIGGAVSAVGDAASAAGSWVTGGATKEQLTSPTYYAKGLGNTVNDFVIQPIWRTASGENVQTLFSPDASLNQRINAVGEDAINIASLFTGGAARGVATGMQAAGNSLARMMAGQGVRQGIRAGTREAGEAAARIAAEEAFKAGSRAAIAATAVDRINTPRTQAMYENRAAQSRLAADKAADEARAALQMETRPEWNFDEEGLMRVWHTSPDGSRLPPRLNSVEEAARMRNRRGGTGAAMLLDGGLYQTESGFMSNTYLEDFFRENPVPVPRHILPEYADNLVSLRHLQGEHPKLVPDISQSLREGAVSLASKPTQSDILNVAVRLPVSDSQKQQLIRELSNNPNLTYEELFSMLPAETNFKRFLAGLKDTAGQSTARVFRADADSPRVLNFGNEKIYVDSDNPAYFMPSGMAETANNVSVRDAINKYAQKKADENQQILDRERNRRVQTAQTQLAANVDSLLDGRWRAQAQLQAQPRSTEIGAELWRDIYRNWENADARVAEQLRMLAQGKIGVDRPWAGGQNYWDLPIERTPYTAEVRWLPDESGWRQENAVTQNLSGITEFAGMPAMDLGNPTPQMVNQIKAAINKYLDKYPPPPGEDVSDSVEQIYRYLDNMIGHMDNTYPERHKNALFSFRKAIDAAVQATNSGRSRIDAQGMTLPLPDDWAANRFTNKEELYNFLRDEIGYGSMPHPGGVTTSGAQMPHQAFAVSRPELLPPSTYLPGADKIFQRRMKDYNDSLVDAFFWDQQRARPYSSVANPQGVGPVRASQREMANRLAAAAWFSNQGINSMYDGSNR